MRGPLFRRLAFEPLEDRRLLAAGDLDTTFRGTGIAVDTLGFSTMYRDVAIQKDGKIVAVGSQWQGNQNDFAVVRYNADGSLDNTFGTGGVVTTAFVSNDEDNANAVAIQSDGKIVVAGTSFNGSSSLASVARYNTDGTLDTAFSGDGKWTSSGSVGSVADVAIQSDGKIVLVGSQLFFQVHTEVWRLTASGVPDTSFDGDGVLVTQVATADAAQSLAIQQDGKLVVAVGTNSTSTAADIAVLRYNSDGSLDTTFDGDGKLAIVLTSADDDVKAVAIQDNGKIVIVGDTYRQAGGAQEVLVMRYNSDGTPDGTFGSSGKVITSFGTDFDLAQDVAIQFDGKIVVLGTIKTHGQTGPKDMMMARYNTDGTLDSAFSGDGKIFGVGTVGHDDNPRFALQADGRIVIAAHADSQAMVERLVGTYPPAVFGDYNSDGLVDGADYDAWRAATGTTVSRPYAGADGNGDGVVDIADYVAWRHRLAAPPVVGSGSALGSSSPTVESAAVTSSLVIAVSAPIDVAEPTATVTSATSTVSVVWPTAAGSGSPESEHHAVVSASSIAATAQQAASLLLTLHDGQASSAAAFAEIEKDVAADDGAGTDGSVAALDDAFATLQAAL